jgi:hypothetical protein
MYCLSKNDEIRNYVAKGIELIITVCAPVAVLVAPLSSSNPPFSLQQHVSACLITSDDNSGSQFIIRIRKHCLRFLAGY